MLQFSIENRIARITLDRPDAKNAFNDELIERLIERFIACNANPGIRAIIISGTGTVFCAGADLNWMKRMAQFDYQQNKDDADRLATLFKTIASSSIPVIAAVNGAAFGGGVGLVAACDIAVAAESAKFCLSEVKLGLVPATIAPYIVRTIGVAQAKRLGLTAEVIDAKQAQAIGLVQSMVPDGELTNSVECIAHMISSHGPAAVKTTKQLFDHVDAELLSPALIEETSRLIAEVRVSDEAKEGMSAFFEKRKPKWVDD